MSESQNNTKSIKRLSSISFNLLGSFVIIFESISLVMAILCLAMTNWKFLKQYIKILNIVSLIIILLLVIINIFLFIKIKNARTDIIKNFQKRMVISFFLLFLYMIIIVFNVYNSIYLSIKLHIADYPEYGGRERDQKYIDSHPEKFGEVPLRQFIIVGFCPSIISVLNLVCLILSVVFRQKMINAYAQMRNEDNNKVKENIVHKRKSKHTNKERNKKNFFSSNTLNQINTNVIINKNNTLNTNISKNEKGTNKDNNSMTIKGKDFKEVKKFTPKSSSKFLLNSNRLDTKETLKNENKEVKVRTIKIINVNSEQGNKNSINDIEREEDE